MNAGEPEELISEPRIPSTWENLHERDGQREGVRKGQGSEVKTQQPKH